MRRVHLVLPIGLIIVGSFFILKPTSTQIFISQVQISGNTATDEFIELYNYSSSSQNISGFGLKKATAGGTISSLVSSFGALSVAPFSYLLVSHADYQAINDITPDILYSNSSASLAANNTILLTDNTGNTIDRVDWGSTNPPIGSPAPNPAPAHSLNRLPNDSTGNFTDSDNSLLDFVDSISNPRNQTSPSRPSFEIVFVPTTTPTTTEPIIASSSSPTTNLTDLRLNEVMPNPESGEEWIEIFNPTTSTLDLTGATLCDSRTEACTIAVLTGTIESNSFQVIYLPSNKLNNSGDSVILKNFEGVLIDEIVYGGTKIPISGQTLARDFDGDGTWKITTTPTPSSTNQITEPPAQTTPVALSSGISSGTYYVEPIKKPAMISAPRDLVSLIWNVLYDKQTKIYTTTLFDVHRTADPRGGEIMYSWFFDDGAKYDGSKIWHMFTTSGIHNIRIEASSTQGTTGNTTISTKVIDDFFAKDTVFIESVEPTPENGEDEFIVIASNTSTPQNLSNWKISLETDKYFIIPIKTVLAPFGKLKFFKAATKLTLNNAGGSIYLSDQSGKVIDIYIFQKNNTAISAAATSSAVKSDGLVKGIKISKSSTSTIFSGIKLSSVRNFKIDSKVAVVGNAISLPNEPYANYFYLSDDSGGIQIYSYKKEFPKFKIGDRLSVNGVVSQSDGVKRIRISSPSNIKILKPQTSSTPKLIPISSVSPREIGKIVSLQGEITDLNSTSLYLDDRSGEILVSLPIKAKLDKNDLQNGRTIKVTGIVESTGKGYKITPRSNSDIFTIDKLPTQKSNNQNITLIGTFSTFISKILKK